MIVGAMIILNGMPWVKYAIDCLYAVCDRLILVENAARWAWDLSDNGLSVDGTHETISSYSDPENKIERIELGLIHDLSEARNCYWECTAKEDILIVLDQDEGFNPEEMKAATKYLQDHSDVAHIRGDYIMLWGDMAHHIQNQWTADGRLLRRKGMYQYQYTGEDTGDSWKRAPDFREQYWPITWYHFGWVGTPSQIFCKTLLQYRYAQDFRWPGYWKIARNMTEEELAWEIAFNHHSFTRRLPTGMVAIEFQGNLPSIYQTHPWIDLTESIILTTMGINEIRNEVAVDHRDYRKWLRER